MTAFKEHQTVVYTDATGKQIDTFVVYDTDPKTGLTHINHMDMLVPLAQLQLHPSSLKPNHMPLADALSFALLKNLKAKYTDNDAEMQAKMLNRKQMKPVYQQAS